MDELFNNPQLIQACKDFGVRQLYVYGSFAKGQAKPDSDIDFIVEFQRKGFSGAFEQFIELKERLEEIVNRPVDLLENRRFRNKIFQTEVERTKKLVYAA